MKNSEKTIRNDIRNKYRNNNTNKASNESINESLNSNGWQHTRTQGRQELFLEANVDELKTLLEVALIQSTGASNRIEGIS